MGLKARHVPGAPIPALRTFVATAQRAAWAHAATIGKLADWLEPFATLWSHVRVSVLAFRLYDHWVVRLAGIDLQDHNETPRPSVGTDELRFAEVVLPIERLPALVEGVSAGVILQRDSPLDAELTLRSRGGDLLTRVSGGDHAPRQSIDRRFYAVREAEYFYRYELTWEGERHFASYFEPQGESSAWLSRAERAFEIPGRGRLIDVARRMGLADHDQQLLWDRPSLVRLTAPVPIAFAKLEQSADRTHLHVELIRGRLIGPEDVVVQVEHADGSTNDLSRVVATSTRVTLPAPKAARVTLQVGYRGGLVQREEVDVLPPLEANPRLAAFSLFERSELLGPGLRQYGARPNDREEDAFERSVAHLLALLGFSVCWWGPHSKTPLSMPEDQSDLLAFSSDNTVFLLVDCTLLPNRDPKSARLIQRARQLQSGLRSRLGIGAPRIVPVLAVAVPLDEVAQLLRDHRGEMEVTVLALGQIEAALKSLTEGAPHAEIAAHLPEPLQCGFEALGRYRLWPGRVV